MSRYPDAEWVPWRYQAGQPSQHVGKPTYYRGQNKPEAVVLHIMQGWQSTARRWAVNGMFPKSWHFSVGRDGSVMQHLDFRDGGYHAGITSFKARNYPPKWPLYKGPNVNVNNYTIGIEHEGFYDQHPWPEAQREASKKLCWWLAGELNIPVDETHFPPHAVIDLRDRPNDFATPAARRLFYAYLKEQEMPEDDMAMEELLAQIEALSERDAILNDVIVMKRDVDRAVNGQHPKLWRIHKLLREAGELDNPQYEGDYKGYA